MILEFDIGNTFAKWRLIDDVGGGEAERGKFFSQPEFLTEQLPPRDIVSAIKISSVVNDAYNQQVAASLYEKYAISAQFAKTQKRYRHLQIAYSQPEKLGVDRWLAMLAASANRECGVMIFSFGSAIFMDIVDASGMHQGGFIVPGIRMMQQSLLRGTQDVEFDLRALYQQQSAGWTEGLGDSTQHCVNQGILVMLASWVKSVELKYARDLSVFVTGGDAEICLGMFQSRDVIHEPELVLNGLKYV